MMSIRLFACVIFLVGGLTACSGVPPYEQSQERFFSQQAKAAKKAEERQELAQALNLWRSLQVLGKDKPQVASSITALEKKIQQRSNSLWREGSKAYAAGRNSSGDAAMLKLLALNPKHRKALDNLKRTTAVSARRQQDKKVAGSTQASLLNVVTSDAKQNATNIKGGNTSGTDSANHSRDSSALRAGLAEQAAEAGNRGDEALELDYLQQAIAAHAIARDPLLKRSLKLRQKLSEDWHHKGAGLVKTDLEGAIAAFEKSLEYNSKNSLAVARLRQARVLQHNLAKIKQK